MRSYGQFCPIAKAAELFCERWTALVVRNIGAGSSRFSDIHRGVPLMSQTLLSQRLKLLEAEGIVERRKSATGRSWTYHLTEAGADFMPIIALLGTWGRRWTRRDLRQGEIDLGLLIWGLEMCVDPTVFGADRHTVRISFSDQPEGKRLFWFVCEKGNLDLCVTDPGYEVDLYLSASLPDLIHLYRGDMGIRPALENGSLLADGPRRMVARLPQWFNFGPLAEVPSVVAS